ncbi:hypothetical protein P154DRAFT_298443 [Amniculicola lignicola CBS 123094]|uniref:Uncharacterized protein n=1 Tax=Amniculicola lignicola CBS 123094 TaxID=1392246 RepID=A0A6A5W8K8_9PLEO|nr:hypothetical protein P154DRAFT_298443 [Amniculicola lignicola CBS 123094]
MRRGWALIHVQGLSRLLLDSRPLSDRISILIHTGLGLDTHRSTRMAALYANNHTVPIKNSLEINHPYTPLCPPYKIVQIILLVAYSLLSLLFCFILSRCSLSTPLSLLANCLPTFCSTAL